MSDRRRDKSADRRVGHWCATDRFSLANYLHTSGLLASLSDAELRTYVAYCYFANHESGLAFPSNRTLAEATGLGERTIRRARAKLHQVGLMRVEDNRGGLRHSTRCIMLNPAKLMAGLTPLSPANPMAGIDGCDGACNGDVTRPTRAPNPAMAGPEPGHPTPETRPQLLPPNTLNNTLQQHAKEHVAGNGVVRGGVSDQGIRTVREALRDWKCSERQLRQRTEQAGKAGWTGTAIDHYRRAFPGKGLGLFFKEAIQSPYVASAMRTFTGEPDPKALKLPPITLPDTRFNPEASANKRRAELRETAWIKLIRPA